MGTGLKWVRAGHEAGCHKQGNETWGSINGREFPDLLGNY